MGVRKNAISRSRISMLAVLIGVLSSFVAQRTANAAGCVGHEGPVLGIAGGTQNDLTNVDLVDTQRIAPKFASFLAAKPCSSDTPNSPRAFEVMPAAIFGDVRLQAVRVVHRFGFETEDLDVEAFLRVGERPPR